MSRKRINPKFTLYNHKFLGPGNEVDEETPLDEDDYIAKIHDQDYEKAKSFEDIKKADYKAIGSFGKDFIHTGNWHSAIGAAGLGIKTLTERALNRQLYPSVSGTSDKRRKLDHNPELEEKQTGVWIDGKLYSSHLEYEKEQSSKKGVFGVPLGKGKGPKPYQRTNKNPNLKPISKENFKTPYYPKDYSNDPIDMDLLEAEQAAGLGGSRMASNSGGAAGGMRGMAQLPSGLSIDPNDTMATYSKEYFFRIKNELIECARKKFTGKTDEEVVITRFPIHDIPVRMLGFYLSKDEIHKIITECSSAEVVECHVEIYNDTATLPFATNQSITTVGNNNVGIELVSMHDLTRHRHGTLPPQWNLIEDRCWGKHLHELQLTNEFAPTNLGGLSAETVQRDLNNKFQYHSIVKEDKQHTVTQPASNYSEHVFPLWRFIKKRINASMNEGLFDVWSYKPKNGKICGRHWLNEHAGAVPEVGNKALLYPTVKIPNIEIISESTETDPIKSSGLQGTSTIETDPYMNDPGRNKILKTPWLNPYPEDYSNLTIENTIETGAIPPSCCIGIFPLASGKPAAAGEQLAVVDAYIKLHVRACIIVHERRGTNNMFRNCNFTVEPANKFPICQPIYTHPNMQNTILGDSSLFSKIYGDVDVETTRGIPYMSIMGTTGGDNNYIKKRNMMLPMNDSEDEDSGCIIPASQPRKKFKQLFK